MPFPKHSQSEHLWYPTTQCAVLKWLTGCHATPLVTKYFQALPKEAEDFLRGGKHTKDVPLPTFLANLKPV